MEANEQKTERSAMERWSDGAKEKESGCVEQTEIGTYQMSDKQYTACNIQTYDIRFMPAPIMQ